MSGSPIIKKALKEKKIRQTELAKYLGIEPRTIYNRLTRDVFPFNDVEKILEWAGYEIVIVDKETKKPLL